MSETSHSWWGWFSRSTPLSWTEVSASTEICEMPAHSAAFGCTNLWHLKATEQGINFHRRKPQRIYGCLFYAGLYPRVKASSS